MQSNFQFEVSIAPNSSLCACFRNNITSSSFGESKVQSVLKGESRGMDFRRKLRVPGEAEPGPAGGNCGRKGNRGCVLPIFQFPTSRARRSVCPCLSGHFLKETKPRVILEEGLESAVFTQPCRLEFRTFLRIEDAPRIPPSKLNVISDLYDRPIEEPFFCIADQVRMRILLQNVPRQVEINF